MNPWLLLLLVPLLLGVALRLRSARPFRRTDLTPLSLRKFLSEHRCSVEIRRFTGTDYRARFVHDNGGVSKAILYDERGETEIDLVSWPGFGSTAIAARDDLVRRYNSIEEPEYVTIGGERPTRKIRLGES